MSPARPTTRAVELAVEGTNVRCSGVVLAPAEPRALYLFAHGAGAGMSHPFMVAVAERLARRSVASLRYQFPYMEQGRRRPDPHHLLEGTVRSAVAWAGIEYPNLALFAGGKSMGGRMTSQAHARAPLQKVRGLIFFGFPLHPRGAPATERARHLYDLDTPMLFLQGTRDDLAHSQLIEEVCARLGPHARLRIVEGADHSFHVLKRSGRNDEEVLDELAAAAADWIGAWN